MASKLAPPCHFYKHTDYAVKYVKKAFVDS